LVQHPDTVKITNAAKRIIEELNLSIYDGKSMKGLVRTIAVRTAVKTGEIQLVLITTRKDIPKEKVLVERVSAIDPNLVSIV
ncbi:23S rRNA (uracil-5-)-methyltransferase RumA, partial [Streptococcus pneumoniae]|nr:23S rRNA (uracil-5-)-methyltransferase RumA [Streptococcus pneumoniae]